MNTTKPGLFAALRLFPVIGFFILVPSGGGCGPGTRPDGQSGLVFPFA